MLRFISFFCILMLAACSATTISGEDATPITYTQQLQNNTEDPGLERIQSRIKNAFIGSIMAKSTQSLDKINDELAAVYEKSPQNIILYWMSYSDYYASIVHIQNENKKASEAAIESSVKRMKNMKNKNAEDYALLAMAQGFSMQFKGMKAMFISRSVAKNLEKAQNIDPENIRVWYVSGSNDFYTPDQYGGGKKVEEYILKAFEMKDQKVENPYLPSWGREEAHEILLQHYMKQEDWEKAKAHFKVAFEAYPKNYRITMMGGKLVGK